MDESGPSNEAFDREAVSLEALGTREALLAANRDELTPEVGRLQRFARWRLSVGVLLLPFEWLSACLSELYPNVVDDGVRRRGRRTLPNLTEGIRRCAPAGKEYA